uniref:Uncharacterized protein n=1 Tax=Theileria annulata TaxID=5874 RepID=A0A3B0MTQ5_THEAN
MQSILLLLLLLSAKLISSRLVNSKNVSLTTELLPHTGDNTNCKYHANKQHGCDSTDIHTNLNYSKSNSYNPTNTPHNNTSVNLISNERRVNGEDGYTDKPGNNERISRREGLDGKGESLSLLKSSSYKRAYDEITRKVTLMVCPFKPTPSLTKAVKHSLKALKLYLVPSGFEKPNLLIFGFTTFFSALFGGAILTVAGSDKVFAKLRDKWAFQGDFGNGSIESITRLGLMILVTDLLFRNTAMKSALFKSLSNSTFLTHANWMTNNLAKLDTTIFQKLFTGCAKGYTVFRLLFTTLLHLVLMKTNWNTGSFMVDHESSRVLSGIFFTLFLVSLFGNLADAFFYGNFSRFLDVQYVLEPLDFRETYKKLRVYEESKNLYFSLPDSLRGLYDTNSRLLFNLYNVLQMIDVYIPYNVEWLFLYLQAAMALYSNSASGIYLSAVQYVYLAIEQCIMEVEKILLNEKVTFKKLFE